MRLIICLLLVLNLTCCSKDDYHSYNAVPLLTKIDWQIDTEDINPEVNPENAIFESFEIPGTINCELTHKFKFNLNNTLTQYLIAPHCYYSRESNIYSYSLDTKNNLLTINKFVQNDPSTPLEDIEYRILLLNEKQLKLSYLENNQQKIRSFKPYQK